MNAEIQTYSHQIRSLLERIVGRLDGLSHEELNRGPPWEGANSPYVVAAHVLGNARAWVLGIACGRPLRRDRPGEFRSSAAYDEIASAARELSAEIETALAALEPLRLDVRLLPSQELWGEGHVSEISVREALLHVIEHASIHLGQLQVTRDFLLRQGSGQVLGERP